MHCQLGNAPNTDIIDFDCMISTTTTTTTTTLVSTMMLRHRCCASSWHSESIRCWLVLHRIVAIRCSLAAAMLLVTTIDIINSTFRCLHHHHRRRFNVPRRRYYSYCAPMAKRHFCSAKPGFWAGRSDLPPHRECAEIWRLSTPETPDRCGGQCV